MKWPEWLAMVRHDVSTYNTLREQKAGDPLYQQFRTAFEADPDGANTRELALQVSEKFALNVGDWNTPLADQELTRARSVGIQLREMLELPDVVFVSPYDRTKLTYEGIKLGWPELAELGDPIEEDRIREREHGLALLYNDRRVFDALHPEQRGLYALEGPYYYRHPQGESMLDVRLRNRSWLGTLIREWASKRVLSVTHHLTILGTRANLERWSAERFIKTDEHEKPINCGVTIYRGDPRQGRNGRLLLDAYNLCLY